MPPLHPCGLRAFVAPPKKPTCSKSALARGGCGAGAKGGVLQLQEAPAAGALTRASCRYQPCINSTAPPCIAHGEAARPPLRPPHLAPHCPTAPMPSLLGTFKSIPSPLCVRGHAHIGKPHPPWSRFLLLFCFLHRNRAAAGRVGGKRGGHGRRAERRGAERRAACRHASRVFPRKQRRRLVMHLRGLQPPGLVRGKVFFGHLEKNVSLRFVCRDARKPPPGPVFSGARESAPGLSVWRAPAFF